MSQIKSTAYFGIYNVIVSICPYLVLSTKIIVCFGGGMHVMMHIYIYASSVPVLLSKVIKPC